MQKLRAEKGITLIALVITIIVMLILVGVSVTVALNGGLFTTAKEAAEGTASKRNEELQLSEGKVQINGQWYNSMDEYVNGSGNGAGGEVTLPTGWEVTEKPATWTSNKVTAIKETATGNIVALPEGYSISEVADEQTVDGGLVITDGTNEFVWIPITTDFTATYGSGEPKELTSIDEYSSKAVYDSQTTLDYYYGEGYYDYPETEEEKANINNNFAYLAHYGEMVESINKYDGFYIGRYETTIDGENIGSKEGAQVLTEGSILKAGTNVTSDQPYYYRWWGLYAAQRNSDVGGNGTIIQTNMIWGQQWDAMIEYFKNGNKDYSTNTLDTSGTDEICNIYDLRYHYLECTADSNGSNYRELRGR